jgi:hypothetical protein
MMRDERRCLAVRVTEVLVRNDFVHYGSLHVGFSFQLECSWLFLDLVTRVFISVGVFLGIPLFLSSLGLISEGVFFGVPKLRSE